MNVHFVEKCQNAERVLCFLETGTNRGEAKRRVTSFCQFVFMQFRRAVIHEVTQLLLSEFNEIHFRR
jgi:hypothetical protein